MSVTPAALRCDYQVAPLALAGDRPVFSWELTSADGATRQTAYRLTVASSPAALDSRPDLWDSGVVESSATFGIAYQGGGLQPRERYWWRVEAFDERGTAAAGPAATFETGQLGSPWTARWIRAPREAGLGPLDSEIGFAGCRWAWPSDDPDRERPANLVAEFRVDDPGHGALLLSAVLGPYTVRLNGHVLDTGTYWRTPYFTDLRPYLVAGTNELSIQAPRTYVGPAGVVGRLYLGAARGAAGSAGEATSLDLADLWSDADSLGTYGDEPWGRLRSITPATVPPVLRRTFTLPASATGRPARLYASALGLYRARLNGSEVGGARLAPGWTDYAQRALYQAYDVGDLVTAGENALEVDLADGWYAGNVACVGRSVYGDRPAFIAELHYGLGGDDRGSLVTDESWISASGPRLAADLLKGEWHHAGGAQPPQSAPRPVETVTGPALAAQIAPEVGVVAEWEPVAMNLRPEVEGGSVLVDFGRNLAGVVRLQLGATGAEALGAAGSTGAVETRTISLRHAEMLDERGELYTSSLRGATQLDLLTVPDQHGAHTFEPSFTVHGFRYVELGGLPPGTAAALAAGPGADQQHDGCRAAVTALEIGSRFTKTGWFHSSHDGLNELVSVIERTIRSNYGVLPTDCPNRDERMGWLDVHALAPSAMHLFDLAAYYPAWLTSMREAQYEDGVLPHVVPDVLAGGGGEAGWADCAVILPWHVYQRYGDVRVLADNYDMMRRWVDYLAAETDDHIRPASGFGDWLAAAEDTPKDLIGTAFFARSATLLSRSAAVLGNALDAERYGALRDSVVRAFKQRFVAPDGVIGTGSQTGYVLALDFDLLPEPGRPLAAARLAAGIRDRGGLATGYMGVPRLLNVLSRFGYDDVALSLVTSRDYPGWGYMLEQGATTLWERWDSYRADGGFADPAMNSFNHPSLCAVLEWLVGDLGGLTGLEPGFTRARFKPPRIHMFKGRLASCEVAYHSMIGEYRTRWDLTGGRLQIEAQVPANGVLEVELPDGRRTLLAGEHRLVVAELETT